MWFEHWPSVIAVFVAHLYMQEVLVSYLSKEVGHPDNFFFYSPLRQVNLKLGGGQFVLHSHVNYSPKVMYFDVI